MTISVRDFPLQSFPFEVLLCYDQFAVAPPLSDLGGIFLGDE